MDVQIQLEARFERLVTIRGLVNQADRLVDLARRKPSPYTLSQLDYAGRLLAQAQEFLEDWMNATEEELEAYAKARREMALASELLEEWRGE